MQRVFRFLAFSVIASLGGATPAIARTATPFWSTVPVDIRAVFDKPAYAKATWGLRVRDGSRTLVDLNSEHPFLIGSVRKVFSVGELLNTIGPGHTYDTPVYRTGAITNGTLHGNLILVASGDLTMGGRTNPDGSIAISNWDHNEADGLGNAILTDPDPLAGYRRLASAMRAYGIKRIAGNVIIDDRLFPPFPFRGQFNVRPIFVNDDLVDLSIVRGRASGARADVGWRPHSAALEIDNQLRTGAANSRNTLTLDPVFPACIGSPGCTARISGSLPSNFVPPLTGQPTLVQAVRIVQPSNYARTVLIEQLAAAGVSVDAPAVAVNPVELLPAKQSYRRADELTELKGLPYADDAKLVMKISYNIGADTTLMLFGLAHHVDTVLAALAIERRTLWSQYGIPSGEYTFVDGSGGGYTTATNAAVTRMLEVLERSRASSAFYDSLPILGVDGSLAFVKDFESDPTLAGAMGNVHAKTGTFIDSVGKTIVLKAQALGGYVTTKRGRHLTFELVVNDVPITGIPDVTNVFQDEGTIAAMLWRDY